MSTVVATPSERAVAHKNKDMISIMWQLLATKDGVIHQQRVRFQKEDESI